MRPDTRRQRIAIAVCPRRPPPSVTFVYSAACGMLDRREALAYLLVDVVIGGGLASAAAARALGQAAGKLVWVAKGTPPLKVEVAAAKQTVQRSAAKRALTPEQLAAEKVDAEAAVLRLPCVLPLPKKRQCGAVARKEAAAPSSEIALPSAPTPLPITASPDAPAVDTPTEDAPTVVTPAIAVLPALPATPVPVSNHHNFTTPAIDPPTPPGLPSTQWSWFEGVDLRLESRAKHARFLQEWDARYVAEMVRQEAAQVGVHFYVREFIHPEGHECDGWCGTAICSLPPPPTPDHVVHAVVVECLEDLVWFVASGYVFSDVT